MSLCPELKLIQPATSLVYYSNISVTVNPSTCFTYFHVPSISMLLLLCCLHFTYYFHFDKRKFTFSHNFNKSEFYIDYVSSYFHFVTSLVSVKASNTPSQSLTASPTSQRPCVQVHNPFFLHINKAQQEIIKCWLNKQTCPNH